VAAMLRQRSAIDGATPPVTKKKGQASRLVSEGPACPVPLGRLDHPTPCLSGLLRTMRECLQENLFSLLNRGAGLQNLVSHMG
jgi:hypothetical protein